MAQLYSAEGEQSCPGEQQCDVWKSSAEDVEVRCPSCPKRQGHEAGAGGKLNDESLLDEIEKLVNERNSSFGFPADLTELEKEAIVLWDRNVAANERAHQQRVGQLFEALVGSGTSRD